MTTDAFNKGYTAAKSNQPMRIPEGMNDEQGNDWLDGWQKGSRERIRGAKFEGHDSDGMAVYSNVQL